MKVTVWIDRARIGGESLEQEITSLVGTVEGLRADWDAALTNEDPRLRGRVREFVPYVDLEHEHKYALEIVCEELIAQFGWCIDIRWG